MEKLCKNCAFWHGNSSDTEASCIALNGNAGANNKSSITGYVEGAVLVDDIHSDFDIQTQKNFGCVHFKVKSGNNK
jgi:expansin (peptidoglycan-binding protein)